MFDLTRLSLIAAHRLETKGLKWVHVSRMTGVPKSQLSRLKSGQAICAGHTFMVMEALEIDPAEMLPPEALSKLTRIRRAHAIDREDAMDGRASRETASETFCAEAGH